jgi:hypothetical protein
MVILGSWPSGCFSLTLSWDKSFDKWSLGFGYIYYAFNGFGFDTEEFYGSVGYDVIRLIPPL